MFIICPLNTGINPIQFFGFLQFDEHDDFFVVVVETTRFLFGACFLDFIAHALHFLAVSDSKYDKVGKAISHFVHILAAFF